ncbi:MAG: lamin tail domain-containing protein [Thermoplasmatales archaeon]|nr:lamin tail domain-containing protein [Thermoplasmatales archaeon]
MKFSAIFILLLICNITFLANGNILIKEVYYYARPNRNNEYICIINTGEDTSLEGWYITIDPSKDFSEQRKILLPDIVIGKGEKIYLTQNGTSFKMETCFEANFEWNDCSYLPDLKKSGNFVLSNSGGVICLKDKLNNTVDVVVYGNAYFDEGWEGKSIDEVKEGVVLRRKDNIDTNTSLDWEYNRTYIIGQSDFPPFVGSANKAIIFCSPDCSYSVIEKEIRNASEMKINLYLFTNPFIADLIEKSGASIKLLLDGNTVGGIPMEERYIAYNLNNSGLVRYMRGNEKEGIYKRYKYNHAKYAIIDDSKVIITSANWGKSGIPINSSYGNREWGIIIYDEKIASFLSIVFEYDWNPSMQDSIEFDENSFTHGKPPNDYSISYFIPKGDYIPKFNPLVINSSFNYTVILCPDNAEEEIIKLIDSAKNRIFVEQNYIYKDWGNDLNPLLKKFIEKNESGVEVRIILDHYYYEETKIKNEETKNFLKNIEVKLSDFLPIHNKGMIVDDKVLISSINWGENSFRSNREVGIIIESEEIAKYFEEIFWYDWNFKIEEKEEKDYKLIIIPSLFIGTFILLYLYWRR